MTAPLPTIRQLAEDALCALFASMSPSLTIPNPQTGADSGLRCINTIPRVLRRPSLPPEDGDCVITPFVNQNGANNSQWLSKLDMKIRIHYEDGSADGALRFGWLRDIYLLLGCFPNLVYQGSSRVDNIVILGDYWGGHDNNTPTTYVEVGLTMSFTQAIDNPGAIA